MFQDVSFSRHMGSHHHSDNDLWHHVSYECLHRKDITTGKFLQTDLVYVVLMLPLWFVRSRSVLKYKVNYPRAFQRKEGDNVIISVVRTYVLRPISSYSFRDTDLKL